MLRSGKGFSRNGLSSLKGNNRFKAIINHEMSIPTVLNQQQRQFMKIFQKNDVSKIREGIDGTSDEKKLGDYIRALAVSSPRDAIAQIERGWENGKIPVSEEIIREYLKSAAQLKVLDTVNLSGILALMQKPNGVAGAALEPNNQLGGMGGLSPQMLSMILKSGQQGSSAGNSPQDPMFIAAQEPSWRSRGFNLLKSVAGIFLVLSFAGAILDEKGGAGSISSRLGMSSIVRQSEESDKSFADVVGIDEAKGELEEIVMYLKDNSKFTRLGGKLPKGILLTGPPGTGKTLLARAIAGEAKVPFFYTSGSEFEEMYVGVGAKRVRELFEAAKTKSPCIIFIDEIDAIGGSRQLKEQSAMKMTLNQLLVEMDGFEQNKGIIVIAATNFPNSLDQALIRPGRFDKHVDVQMPDIAGRRAILELYAKKVPLNKDVDMEQLARGTPGFSGAELYNLVNQAAVKASVDGLKSIGMQAFEYAKDKIMMGAERKSAVLSKDTMKMTAFHEAGHALIALKTDGADPIHKATIMPRGRALGMVMQLPDGDQTSQSRKQMLAFMDICMGGRIAEEIVYGAENVTSGASSDIQQATRLAKSMVTKWGMSDKVGVMFLDDKEKQSGETQAMIDNEVRQLLAESYSRATKIMQVHRKDLDIIANGLVEYETLSGGEIVDLLSGVKPNMKGLRTQRPSRATIALPIGAPDKIRVTAKDTPKDPPPSIFSMGSGSSGTPAGSAGADVTTPPTVAKDSADSSSTPAAANNSSLSFSALFTPSKKENTPTTKIIKDNENDVKIKEETKIKDKEEEQPATVPVPARGPPKA
mmetsp:Transcript_18773/g.18093  ORF Transcript_18773/g.18093 Transcript_18773/m.18093 type:complete len:812 (-) Transcript_18773:205-2640(-)|eukprot:CAMPEP_0119042940 /NCGR_PEP_ID=MMETSP1177-20130426/16287_1 /TAXON_ID=2985 /ORGANISM="Ochromonas sp, Strain CCMP1899" /LENGTH=811 /DNA_ID=CAMNT_0007010065 /DNA_START=143 /DNA_END=2578 /DNA_ORIENTATION=+